MLFSEIIARKGMRFNHKLYNYVILVALLTTGGSIDYLNCGNFRLLYAIA